MTSVKTPYSGLRINRRDSHRESHGTTSKERLCYVKILILNKCTRLLYMKELYGRIPSILTYFDSPSTITSRKILRNTLTDQFCTTNINYTGNELKRTLISVIQNIYTISSDFRMFKFLSHSDY